jgi:quercetin dioxygenase-like cupin family protein
MRRSHPLLVAAIALYSLTGSSNAAGQKEQIVPVHQEPRHRIVYDSPGARVLDVQIPPGDTTLFHTHSDPILYVNISGSTMRSQTLGSEWNGTPAAGPAAAAPFKVAPSTPPGRMMSTTSYAERPVTHRVSNVGESLYRLIATINASAGDESAGPSPGFDSAPEITNRWFRGYRAVVSGDAGSEHRHANPVNVVLVSGRASATIGSATKVFDQAGQFAFIEPNVPHRLAGLGGEAQLVEVEVRRPR